MLALVGIVPLYLGAEPSITESVSKVVLPFFQVIFSIFKYEFGIKFS